MRRRHRKAGLAAAVAVALLAGCASSGVLLPDGTLMLGEVRHVLTREMVSVGEIAPGYRQENLAQIVRNRGWTDAQIDQGRVVVVRYRIYWYSSIGGKYDELGPELLSEGLSVEVGNVVELAAGVHGVVTRVRAPSLAEGPCYYGDVAVGAAVEALGALSLTGPRGTASLYCAGIEREGWQRPRTYWHKLPGAAADSAAATAAPPLPVAPSAVPEPLVESKPRPGFAVLIFRRSHDNALASTPFWVDGEKAAVLDAGTCDMVLVSPGEHVVAAGSAESATASSLLPGLAPLPKRVLKVVVGAEERVVLDYTIDTNKLGDMFSALAAPFRAEKWSAEVFRFEMRPAEARDSCTLRHEPAWRGKGAYPFPQGQP